MSVWLALSLFVVVVLQVFVYKMVARRIPWQGIDWVCAILALWASSVMFVYATNLGD